MSKLRSGDASAFNWEGYFRFTAEMEEEGGGGGAGGGGRGGGGGGGGGGECWPRLERRTRGAVKGVHFCDVTALDEEGRFLAGEGGWCLGTRTGISGFTVEAGKVVLKKG